MYKYVSDVWKKPKETLGNVWKQRLVQYRKEGTVVRVQKPTRIDRARSLGYKAKQGIIVVRVKVKKGKRKRPKIARGRRPKRVGRFFTLQKSKQVVGEEKASKKFPNMEVLNSYYLAEDGQHKWFECILVDRAHPSVKTDKRLGWISDKKGRAHRGLTSAGKKSRGLGKKGKGTEKVRPSLRKHKRKAA